MGLLGLSGLRGGFNPLVLSSGPAYTVATGGIMVDFESPTSPGTYYRAHVYKATGTFVVTEAAPGGDEYVVIGGG